MDLKVEVDGATSKRDNAVEAVVGAAYGLSGARVSTGTDNAERGAGNSDKACDTADSNAKETKETCNTGAGGLLDGVTALQAAGVTLVRRTRLNSGGRGWCSVNNCCSREDGGCDWDGLGDWDGLSNWDGLSDRYSLGDWNGLSDWDCLSDGVRLGRRYRLGNRDGLGNRYSLGNWNCLSDRDGLRISHCGGDWHSVGDGSG